MTSALFDPNLIMSRMTRFVSVIHIWIFIFCTSRDDRHTSPMSFAKECLNVFDSILCIWFGSISCQTFGSFAPTLYDRQRDRERERNMGGELIHLHVFHCPRQDFWDTQYTPCNKMPAYSRFLITGDLRRCPRVAFRPRQSIAHRAFWAARSRPYTVIVRHPLHVHMYEIQISTDQKYEFKFTACPKNTRLFLPGATKSPPGLGATNLLLLLFLLLLLLRTIWAKGQIIDKFSRNIIDNLLTTFWQLFDNIIFPFFMVLASCGNKYYGTNFIYAVPSSLLIAPGLWTIQFLFLQNRQNCFVRQWLWNTIDMIFNEFSNKVYAWQRWVLWMSRKIDHDRLAYIIWAYCHQTRLLLLYIQRPWKTQLYWLVSHD
jgi:hypothetical protein